MTRRSRAREVALQLLFQRDANPGIDRPAIEKFAGDRLREKDLVWYCLDLFDATISKLTEIDAALTAAAENWRLPRMAAVDRNALRLGALELMQADPDKPPAVVISEAIELARRYGSAESPTFVNGVLDRVHRDLSAPKDAEPSAAPVEA